MGTEMLKPHCPMRFVLKAHITTKKASHGPHDCLGKAVVQV
jgi:hypothetical protein